MAIKIVVYSDPYLTNIVDEVTGFSNAREAAHHRDNSELWDKYTQLQQDAGRVSSIDADDMRSENTDDGSQEQTKQIIEYYPDWVSSLKNAAFYVLLFLIVGIILFSFVVLAVSMGVTGS